MAGSGADPDTVLRGIDPDPYQNVTDPQHCQELKNWYFIAFIVR
jgi:hypothetical protein